MNTPARLRTAIATVSLSGTLENKLEALSRAGFDGYELFENDFIASELTAAQLRRRSADLGLTLELYQPFRDVEGVAPEMFFRTLRRARAKFELMQELGTDTVLICSNVATADPENRERAAEQLASVAELAAQYGITVAYEALAWGRFVSTYDEAWRLVAEVDHPNLGICLDSFHILSRATPLDAIAGIPGEKIAFVQLADAPAMRLDVLSWSRHYRLFPGQGDWDLSDFMRRILAAGYTGPLSIEVFNDVFRQRDADLTARDALRSLRWLEDEINGVPTPAPSETAYVEFRPGAGTALRSVLTACGFTDRGPHRRKASRLWSQGDARIVVNESLDGARAGIAGIGLSVQDVPAAERRIRALSGRFVPRDAGPDEATIATVLGPEGVEYAFAPSGGTWMTEFGESASTAVDAGVLGIDHVSLSQPWLRSEESTLFLRSVVGLTADPSSELPSPEGLVRSRSFVSPNRRIRLATNVQPVAGETSSFPNHVAFSVADAVDTAARLDAAQAPVLRMPANYYDDLAARFDLEPATLEAFRRHSVLYDRDEAGGEFLHFYLRPVGELILEFVERRGGYEGYGATDAYVRLAAQRGERR